MREMEQLIDLLFPKEGPRLEDLKFFEGEKPVKIEEFCAEAHAAFVQVDSGRVKPNADLDEACAPVSADQFLKAS
jgi:hypothetical protein